MNIQQQYQMATDAIWASFKSQCVVNVEAYRPHQADIVQSILSAVCHGHKDICVVLPTGGGKAPILSTLPILLPHSRFSILCQYIAINENNFRFYRDTDNTVRNVSGNESLVRYGF